MWIRSQYKTGLIKTYYVKVIKKWRDREKYLSEFGFNEFE